MQSNGSDCFYSRQIFDACQNERLAFPFEAACVGDFLSQPSRCPHKSDRDIGVSWGPSVRANER